VGSSSAIPASPARKASGSFRGLPRHRLHVFPDLGTWTHPERLERTAAVGTSRLPQLILLEGFDVWRILENVEMKVFEFCGGVHRCVQSDTSKFPEFGKHGSDGLTLFRTALVVPSPKIRSFAALATTTCPYLLSPRTPYLLSHGVES
jgi:hypothetical protein